MLIAIEGMRFYAYHGYYEEERLIGGYYAVDVQIEADVAGAGIDDDLSKTINYETIHAICKIQMREPQKLLESVLLNLFSAIKKQFSSIFRMTIRVRKTDPPLDGRVDSVFVEQSESYGKSCPRCGAGIICYNDRNCWCNVEKVHIHPRTLEMLSGQYKGCLCARCLKQYAG